MPSHQSNQHDDLRRSGLPGDEYRRLTREYARRQKTQIPQDRDSAKVQKKQPKQTREVIRKRDDKHYKAPPKHVRRQRDADIVSSTQQALGPGHDTADLIYSVEFIDLDRGLADPNNDPDYYDIRQWNYSDEGKKPIPKKYIDEFNQKWHEYDEDHDADQYMADIMPNAPWRNHVLPEHHYDAPRKSKKSCSDISSVKTSGKTSGKSSGKSSDKSSSYKSTNKTSSHRPSADKSSRHKSAGKSSTVALSTLKTKDGVTYQQRRL
jgi:hypothetical protein